MRIGIAGTGRIGAFHATALAVHPEVTELVVYDADRARAEEVAAATGGVASESVEALLSTALDGLVIATPTASHVGLIKLAVDKGVPAFCEKPVALDVEGTRDVLEYVDGSDVPVQIGFQRRFDAGYAAAREAVRNGSLGDLRRVHLVNGDPAPPAGTFIMTSGGIYRDLLIHDFDMLRWVTGREVVEVYAAGANRGADFFRAAGDVDETAIVLLLDDATLATVLGSRYNGAGYDTRMEVAGTASTYVVGLSERTPIRSAEPDVTFPEGKPWMLFWDRFEAAYTAELHAFVDVAAGRCDSPCTVADALEALYVAEAAELSRGEHRAVRVEDFAANSRIRVR